MGAGQGDPIEAEFTATVARPQSHFAYDMLRIHPVYANAGRTAAASRPSVRTFTTTFSSVYDRKFACVAVRSISFASGRRPGAGRLSSRAGKSPRGAANVSGAARAILQGAVQILEEFGGLQAALKRSVALEKQARQQAGRGAIHRGVAWQTVRLAGARYR